MSNRRDERAVRYALEQLDDGFSFESFAQGFLAAVLGHEFFPAGKIRDRGIDGFDHALCKGIDERNIYQVSIQQDAQSKLTDSLTKLVDNGVVFTSLTLVTSRTFADKDRAEEAAADQFEKRVRIYDAAWFAVQINANENAARVYERYVDQNLHAFAQPGHSYALVDQVNDPRLFVFLRQQVDHGPASQDLQKTLADTLILYALRDSAPEDGKRLSRAQILGEIAKLVGFTPKLLEATIDRRLKKLAEKRERRVNHHTVDDTYCLPYETRQKVADLNLEDNALHQNFREQTEEMLKKHLKAESVTVRDALVLLENAIGRLFYELGLELSQFLLGEEGEQPPEKNLLEMVTKVVSDSNVVTKNRARVARALHATIRDLIYTGSTEQCEYLQRLSRTYMMLFMLKCDPKIASFFSGMASRLRVYVDTSILIPALSEHFLHAPQRRYAGLLRGARDKGVNLRINDTILDELVAHFVRIKRRYAEEFEPDEELYLGDEIMSLYVDEILIRAYFYAKRRGEVTNFPQYLENFVSPDLTHARDELMTLLTEDFGIEYVNRTAAGTGVALDDIEKLYDKLKRHKSDDQKARNDANLVLMVYRERELNAEAGQNHAFGYATWWLSTDRRTQRAVNTTFGQRYTAGCYMRPEFLNSYISLAPSPVAVDSAFKEIFPSFAGVNISAQLPRGTIEHTRQLLKEHKGKSLGRRHAILRRLADQIRTGDGAKLGPRLTLALDEELADIELGSKG